MRLEDLNELNARCYNARADYWDRFPFADILPKMIGKCGKRALDIGSGTGMLAEWLQQQGYEVLCLDPSEEMVKRTRAKNLTTIQTTIQQFETREKFDLILAILSLIHVPKNDMAHQLERIAGWLMPEGTFVLALIQGSGEGTDETEGGYPRYFSYYSREEILALTEKHFTCIFETQVSRYLLLIFHNKETIANNEKSNANAKTDTPIIK